MSDENQDRAEAEPTQGAEPTAADDPFKMDLADLAARINSRKDDETAEPAEPTVEAAPEEQEPAAEPDESGVEDEAEEAKDERKEEAKEPDAVPMSAEELQAELDSERAERRHQESVAGRLSGELGHTRRQNKELLDRLDSLERRLNDSDANDDEDRPRQRQQEPRQPTLQQYQSQIAQRAAQLAALEFVKEHPDAIVKNGDGQKLSDEMQAAYNAANVQDIDFIGSGDPQYVYQQASAFLTSLWSQVEAGRARARRDEIRKKQSDGAKVLRDKKIASSASSGTRPTVQKRKPPLDPEKMDIEQLRKLIDDPRTLEAI